MKGFCYSGAACLAMAWPGAGWAQANDETEVAENDSAIVVTAQRRSENVQDVPISIAAFSGEALDRAGVADVTELQRVTPGLQITRGTQVANQRVQIRGVGTSSNNAIDPSVGLFLDGIFVPRPAAMLGAFTDLEAVEVLRGPQGTLFGRNTTMGVISVRTKAPRLGVMEGYARVSAGRFNSYGGELAINLPVSDRFAVRAVGAINTTDGPARNGFTGGTIGENRQILTRLGLAWEPTERTRWVVRADYLNTHSDGAPFSELLGRTFTPTSIANWQRALDPDGAAGPLSGPMPDIDDAGDRRLSYFSDSRGRDRQFGFTSDFSQELGGGFSLKLINGYRDWKNQQQERDVLLTPFDLVERVGQFRSRSQSHELQISSPERELLGGGFDFVAGLYYFREEYNLSDQSNLGADYCTVLIGNFRPALVAPCLTGPKDNAGFNTFDQVAKSYAAFGQGVVHLAPTLDLTLGLRYTREEKEGRFFSLRSNVADLTRTNEDTDLATDGEKATYRINLSWRPVGDTMLFGSFSTGYKAGGFESAAGTTELGDRRIFRPETVENIEFGARSQIFDRAVTANITFYRTTINDFQVRAFDGIGFLTRNAGKLRQQGVEADLRWRVVPGLTASVAATYLDSEYLSYPNAPNLPGFGGTQDLTGARAPYSPEFQGTAALDYESSFSNGWGWSLGANLYFVTDQNVGGDGNNPQAVQNGYALFGLRASVAPTERLEFSLVGQNVADHRYCATMFNQPFDQILGLRDPVKGGTAIRCTIGMPATWTAEAKLRF